MNFRVLVLFIIGSIVASIMFANCTKDDEDENPENSSTEGNFTDSRDGKTYKWIKIGEQIWMAENLAYHIDTVGCWAYDNNENYVSTYGYLYNWSIANIVAPAGWHLPTDEEWTTLQNYLMEDGYSYDGVIGGEGIAKALSSETGWQISVNQGAVGNDDFPEFRNKTGFSALPGGAYLLGSGSFVSLGGTANWWSSTENGESNAWPRIIMSADSKVHTQSHYLKLYGLSVRCVKD